MIGPVESSKRNLGAAFDPRQALRRDPFNEIFVLVLSAVSASVVIPVALLIAAILTGKIPLPAFVVISAALELAGIFGFGRPQMQPDEKLAWALLWAFTAAVLGAAFWFLVYDAVL